ncbi:hypothetical protein DFJ77DRAFT_436677 [Powellomyces hirtus]|nr:hypothetical protein DFJ77DRAFT_436677 [Powellomyces hirtus]
MYLRLNATLSRDFWHDVFTEKNLRFKTAVDASQSSRSDTTPLDASQCGRYTERGDIINPGGNPGQNLIVQSLFHHGLCRSQLLHCMAAHQELSSSNTPHSNYDLIQTVENMRLLGRYSHQLPKSWFISDLMKACLKIGVQAEAMTDKYAERAVLATMQLISSWFRKFEPSAIEEISMDIMQFVDRTARRAFEDPQISSDLLVQCLLALCYSIGKLPTELSLSAIDALCLGLQTLTTLGQADQSAVYAGLANLMRTLPPAPLEALSSALLRASGTIPNLTSCMRLISLYEYIALAGHDIDQRSLDELEASGGWKWWKFWKASRVKADPFACVKSLIASSDEARKMSSDNTGLRVAALLAKVGIIRGLEQGLLASQNKQIQSEAEIASLEYELRVEAIKQLTDLAFLLTDSQEDVDRNAYLQIISYLSAEILHSSDEPALQRMDLELQPLLFILIDVILTHPEALYLDGGFLNDLVEEAFEEPSRERPLQTQLDEKVNKTTQHPLYAEMGRISRVIGVLVGVQWARGKYSEVESVLERIHDFCEETHNSWGASEKPTVLSEEGSKSLWQYLKTVLFVTTVIAHSFADILLDEEPPKLGHTPESKSCARQAVQHVLQSFASLHFVTARFGLGGFKIWQETLQALVTWVEERSFEANGGLSRNSGTGTALADEIVRSIAPAYRGIYVHPNALLKTRLIFFLTVCRLLLRHLSPAFVSDQLLPRIYPYLTFNTPMRSYVLTVEDKDLFELSHAACITLFESAGWFTPLVSEFAGWYSTMLIARFPDPIDFDLMRRSFTTMIKSLSTISSAGLRGGKGSEGRDNDYEGEDADEVDDRSGATLRNSRKVDLLDEASPMIANKKRKQRGPRIYNETDAQPEMEAANDSARDAGRRDGIIAEKEAEGDLLAWMCIARLADAIYRLSIEIDAAQRTAHKQVEQPATAQNQKSPTESVAPPKSPVGTSSRPPSSLRFDRILAASSATRLITRRDQLTMVLFDQVPTIGLSGLEPLLATIRHVMLGGAVASSRDLLLPDAIFDDDAGIDIEEHMSIAGVGTQTDPDSSPLWQTLFDAVGHYRGFDYTRREHCVRWYLQTLHDARTSWDKLRPAKRMPLQAQLEAPHPDLRAKL